VVRYALTVLLVWTSSVVVAEGVFRICGDRPSQDLVGLYGDLGTGNYRLRPSTDTSALWSTGAFAVHTDELGLRCDADRRFGSRVGDHVDFMLLGDSQGFGHGLNFEQTVAGTVAQLAEKKGYVVRNACVGGQSPLNQLDLARSLRDDDHLKIDRYVYLFTPTGVSACSGFTRVAVGADGRLYEGAQTRLLLFRTWIKTHSVAYTRVRDAIRSSGIGVKADVQTPLVFQLYETGDTERANKAHCEEFLSRLTAFAADAGATVTLVYVPLTLEANFEAVRQAASRLRLTVDNNAPFRALSAAARRLNLSVHDLRPVLQSVYASGQQLSLLPDFHYTAALSQAAGNDIWKMLAASARGPATEADR